MAYFFFADFVFFCRSCFGGSSSSSGQSPASSLSSSCAQLLRFDLRAEAFGFALAFAFALGAAGSAPLASFMGFSRVLGRNGKWLGARLQKVDWTILP